MKAGRFLWFGDAVSKTGFAQVTHAIVPRLIAAGWQGAVCGINYNGDPHRYSYPIFVAELGGDVWGLGRVEELHRKVKPDVIIVNNDPWNVREFSRRMKDICPVVGYMPIDSPNVPACRDLNDLRLAIWYTEFGKREAVDSGYDGPSAIVPHGVDQDVYQPKPRAEAFEVLGLSDIPADAFIVGNANRNTARKRLDLTVMFFAEWWERAGKPENAYLYLHTSNLDSGPNLLQLAVRLGLKRRVMLTNRTMKPGEGIDAGMMPFVYSLFDVQVSTTQGEGWGLTTLEGMACGVPQLVPEYAALAEWPAGAVTFVPCTSFYVNGHGVNSIGGVPDREYFIQQLDLLYQSPDLRAELGKRALDRARDPRFNWNQCAALFDAHLRGALQKPNVEAPGVVAGGQSADESPEQTVSPAGDEGTATAGEPARVVEGAAAPSARTKTGPVPLKAVAK